MQKSNFTPRQSTDRMRTIEDWDIRRLKKEAGIFSKTTNPIPHYSQLTKVQLYWAITELWRSPIDTEATRL